MGFTHCSVVIHCTSFFLLQQRDPFSFSLSLSHFPYFFLCILLFTSWILPMIIMLYSSTNVHLLYHHAIHMICNNEEGTLYSPLQADNDLYPCPWPIAPISIIALPIAFKNSRQCCSNSRLHNQRHLLHKKELSIPLTENVGLWHRSHRCHRLLAQQCHRRHQPYHYRFLPQLHTWKQRL